MSTSDVYDSYWKEGGHVTQEWTEKFFQESYGPVIRMKKVLGYGCGMGNSYQNLLIRTDEGYVGKDIFSVAVENTRAKGGSAVAIQEDGTVPLPDRSFEGAF